MKPENLNARNKEKVAVMSAADLEKALEKTNGSKSNLNWWLVTEAGRRLKAQRQMMHNVARTSAEQAGRLRQLANKLNQEADTLVNRAELIMKAIEPEKVVG